MAHEASVPRVSVLARVALGLALVPYLLPCLVPSLHPIPATLVFLASLTVVPALLVLALAMAARWRIVRRPGELGGVGFANAASTLCIVNVFLAIALMVLLPNLRAIQVNGGPTCASNLRGIVQSMMVYAAENNGVFPLGAPPAKAYTYSTQCNLSVAADDGAGAVKQLQSPEYGGNVLTIPWILVLGGQCTPKQFVCRSDPFFRGWTAALVDSSGRYRITPEKADQFSYSFAYPWLFDAEGNASVAPWWKTSWRSQEVDSLVPLACDMAPLAGTGKPKRDPAPRVVPRDNSTWNSFNHAGAGQQVAYADGHVDWFRDPLAGQATKTTADNIFSIGPTDARGVGGTAAAAGRVPAIPVPVGEVYDMIMVPLRDGDTGEIK